MAHARTRLAPEAATSRGGFGKGGAPRPVVGGGVSLVIGDADFIYLSPPRGLCACHVRVDGRAATRPRGWGAGAWGHGLAPRRFLEVPWAPGRLLKKSDSSLATPWSFRPAGWPGSTPDSWASKPAMWESK